MQVEMSLAELLINAITHGKIPGVQFKRGWSDDRATFAGLNTVIGDRLDGARRVAVQEALYKLQDEHPLFKTRAENKRLRAWVETNAVVELIIPGDPEVSDGWWCAACDLALMGKDEQAVHFPTRDAVRHVHGCVLQSGDAEGGKSNG